MDESPERVEELSDVCLSPQCLHIITVGGGIGTRKNEFWTLMGQRELVSLYPLDPCSSPQCNHQPEGDQMHRSSTEHHAKRHRDVTDCELMGEGAFSTVTVCQRLRLPGEQPPLCSLQAWTLDSWPNSHNLFVSFSLLTPPDFSRRSEKQHKVRSHP